MRKFLEIFAVAILLLACTDSSFAQFQKKRYWSAGVTFNAINYFGDVVPLPSRLSWDPKFTRLNTGGFAQYRFHPRMTARGSFTWGRLKGDDRESVSEPGTSEFEFNSKQ